MKLLCDLIVWTKSIWTYVRIHTNNFFDLDWLREKYVRCSSNKWYKENWRWFWHWIKSPSSHKFVLVATYDLQCFKSKQSFFKKPSRYHLEITIFTKIGYSCPTLIKIVTIFQWTVYIWVSVLDYVYGKFMCKVYFQDPYPFFTHHRFLLFPNFIILF